MNSLFGGNEKKDQSGEVSNEKEVGYFKGMVEVAPTETKINFRADKTRLLNNIIKLINEIYKQKYGDDIDF